MMLGDSSPPCAGPGRVAKVSEVNLTVDTVRNDNSEERDEKQWEDRAPAPMMRWLILTDVLFFAAALFAGGYAYQQSSSASNLAAQNQGLHAMIDQMRAQVDTLTGKLQQITSTPPAQASAASAPVAKRNNPAGASSVSLAVQDRRLNQVQSQLAEQQKQLQATQEQIEAANSDLEGKLGTTREELNGSIARTHNELLDLESRGARRYFEFHLSKSKGFQHEGPIQISLLKIDAKHQSYDVMMLVDDHKLAKKKVDLYEPIWLHKADLPEPVQIVVNKIDKDHIEGYVSAPRFTEPELASSAARASSDTFSKPISTPSRATSSYPTSTPPSTSATTPGGQQSPSE